MSTEARVGDWMQLCSGRKFYPLDPRPDEIEIADIAGALSRVCRFGGHVREFYSVAQHSVLVSHVCDPIDALWGLLHDASEAYLGDIIRPLKRQACMQAFCEADQRVMLAVRSRFGLRIPECPRCTGTGHTGKPHLFWGEECKECGGRGWLDMPPSVHRADEIVLATEARDLMRNEALERWSSLHGIQPLEEEIQPQSPQVAWERFMQRFEELTRC